MQHPAHARVEAWLVGNGLERRAALLLFVRRERPASLDRHAPCMRERKPLQAAPVRVAEPVELGVLSVFLQMLF